MRISYGFHKHSRPREGFNSLTRYIMYVVATVGPGLASTDLTVALASSPILLFHVVADGRGSREWMTRSYIPR